MSGSKFCFDVSTWHMPTGFGMGVLFGNLLRQVTVCVTGEEHGRAIGICPDKAILWQGKIITSVCRQAGTQGWVAVGPPTRSDGRDDDHE